jgi:glycosyltransferase involved in cell wall biosynthesis
MKIALIIDTWYPAIGGGQVNAWEISRRLAKKGYEIDIITRNNGRFKLPIQKKLKIYQLGYRSKPDDNFAKVLFVLSVLIFLLRRKYDLIHIHPFLSALITLPLKFSKKVPVIFTVHGTRLFEREQKKGPSISLEKFILTKIKYDAVISVTSAFLKFKNVNTNIFVVPNGIDVEKFKKYRKPLKNGKTILWVGRFDRVKRVEDLIFAFSELQTMSPNAILRLVGYGYQEKLLKSLTRSLKLKNVHFIGPKFGKDLILEYQRADVFVLPSISEGQPQVILESLALGIPVVATDVGGVPEILKNTPNSYLIPPKSPNLLAKKILEAFNPNGQKRVNFRFFEKYNWNKIADQTLEIYKKTLRSYES